MVNLAKTVLITKNYAAHFDSCLDDEGLHHWLISEKIVPKNFLSRFPQKLTQGQLQKIKSRQEVSRIKIEKAKRIVRLLSLFPTISMICLTGSLAVGNAQKYDDLDFFIITTANTLWLTRPLVILFLKFSGLRRPTSLPEHQSPVVCDKVCDNLWLDEAALALPKNKRNLYTAHEVLQAKPLFDRGGTHAKFILANSWTSKYLANAYAFAKSSVSSPVLKERKPRTRGGEVIVRVTNWLNYLAFKLQFHYMKSKITRETITLHSAYFHPNDYALIDLDG